MAYIYFIYEHGSDNTFKIGFSTNPDQRLRNLQTGNSRLLQIWRTIECSSKKIAKCFEGALHVHYIRQCRGGEWFSISIEEINKSCMILEHMMVNELPSDLFEETWETFFPIGAKNYNYAIELL
jgi:hypothetical protein